MTQKQRIETFNKKTDIQTGSFMTPFSHNDGTEGSIGGPEYVLCEESEAEIRGEFVVSSAVNAGKYLVGSNEVHQRSAIFLNEME